MLMCFPASVPPVFRLKKDLLMRKAFLFVLFLVSAVLATAQQSSKSKSKDRYREKESPPRTAVEQQIEQWVPLRRLSEEQLPAVVEHLSEAARVGGLLPMEEGRMHAYAWLAAYEVMARYSSRTPSLRGLVEGMPPILAFAPTDSVFYPYAALAAALEVGRLLLPASPILQQRLSELEQRFVEQGLPAVHAAYSQRAAKEIASIVGAFARNSSPQRTFLLPPSEPLGWANPTPEDMREGSRYRLFVREIFERGGSNATAEHYAVVELWCGQSRSLPAQWLLLGSTACLQQRMPFALALRALTATSLAMADAYAVCAQESGQYLRSSPEQAVRQLHDPNWQPCSIANVSIACEREYGLVSASAAAVLSRFLGERMPFQWGGNAYASFREAARQAAMARFYAGYQLRDVVEAGLVSGERLGSVAMERWPQEQ